MWGYVVVLDDVIVKYTNHIYPIFTDKSKAEEYKRELKRLYPMLDYEVKKVRVDIIDGIKIEWGE